MRRLRQRSAVVLGLSAAAAVVVSAVAGGAAFAAAPEGTVRGAQASGAIKDRYIVVLKADRAESAGVDSAARGLTRQYGGAVGQSYTKAVHGFSAQLSETAAKRLAANPAVEYVEQDRRVTIAQANPPSWGLDRIDQNVLPLNLRYTYPNTAGNVTAYVIDTGVRISHKDFGGRARNGYDFVDRDAVANDCQGHGTHVAGTIGGTAYGVAKAVKLVAVRVMDCQGSGTYSQIIAGVDWVTKNAVKPAVANMSIGGPAGSTLDNAVKASIAAGVTYAVAAGNDNVDACTQSPARLAAAITVGATDVLDRRASFSNYGTCLDLFAPGVGITSAHHTGDTASASMSGTSMASPHVAGSAALILSANPTATPAQVRDSLVNNALAGKVTGAGPGSPNKLLREGITTVTPVSCPVAGSGTNVTIADRATVVSPLTVAGCVGAASGTTRVVVDIKHTDRGDLVIDLIAPDGSVYRLKNATSGDDVANLAAAYTVNASSEARNGVWKLRVTDGYAGDSGYIDSWSLAV